MERAEVNKTAIFDYINFRSLLQVLNGHSTIHKSQDIPGTGARRYVSGQRSQIVGCSDRSKIYQRAAALGRVLPGSTRMALDTTAPVSKVRHNLGSQNSTRDMRSGLPNLPEF